VWSVLGMPLLFNYTITNHFYLPIDLESITGTVKNLEGIVSKTKQLEMIPGVDPELEMYRMEEERKGSQEETPLPLGEPLTEEKRENIIESGSNAFEEDLRSKYIANLKNRLGNEILESDEFKKLLG
jgi:hypothetical protein